MEYKIVVTCDTRCVNTQDIITKMMNMGIKKATVSKRETNKLDIIASKGDILKLLDRGVLVEPIADRLPMNHSIQTGKHVPEYDNYSLAA